MQLWQLKSIKPENIIAKACRVRGTLDYHVVMRNGDEMTLGHDHIFGRGKIANGTIVYKCSMLCSGPGMDGMCTRGVRRYNPTPCDHQMHYVTGGFGAKRAQSMLQRQKDEGFLVLRATRMNTARRGWVWRVKFKFGNQKTIMEKCIINTEEVTAGNYLVPCSLVCRETGGVCQKCKNQKEPPQCFKQFWYQYRSLSWVSANRHRTI